jgi:hypothetical protein
VAGVGLVPSPVGLRRYGITIAAIIDEDFLRQSHELAFTEKIDGGVGGEI